MNINYQFSNVVGLFHSGGPLVFDESSENEITKSCLLSTTSNRITTFDFANNSTSSTNQGHDYNIDTFALSHNSKILVTASVFGNLSFFSYPKGIILRKENVSPQVFFMKFSENSKFCQTSTFFHFSSSHFLFHRFLAVGGTYISIYKTSSEVSDVLSASPSLVDLIEESGVRFHCVDWCKSDFIVFGTDKACAYLYKLDESPDQLPKLSEKFVLAGVTGKVVGCFFENKNGSKNPLSILLVDENGTVVHWKFSQSKWKIISKFSLDISVSSCDVHFDQQLLLIGRNNGFNLIKLNYLDNQFEETAERKSFEILQELNTSDSKITSATFNKSGNWLAVGSGNRGQVLVWDWSSETYILKQQSHNSNIKSLCYSSIGDVLASGDEEGKIKVYESKSGQCFVTLDKFCSGPITGMVFSRPPNSRDAALFCSSEDGTCRAFDLLRYTNFRVYTAEKEHYGGFSNVAVDPSGEIISASLSQSPYAIYIWNVQTKQTLDKIISHTAPITQLKFSGNLQKPVLMSSSWDKTVKIWDIFGSKANAEVLQHTTEVMTFALRPDGEELCASTIDGQLSFWNIKEATQTGFIEASRDISIDKSIQQTEKATRAYILGKKYFSKVCYTNDGSCVICGGSGQQYLNLYSVEQKVLLKRFVLSTNLNLKGVSDMSHHATASAVDFRKAQADRSSKLRESKGKGLIGDQKVPGARNEIIADISCFDISFSPSSQEFAVATPEGISIFSTQHATNFQPLELDPSITSHSILKSAKSGNYAEALVNALRLNEYEITSTVLHHIPKESIDLIARTIPQNYVDRFLTVMATEIDKKRQLEFHLLWVRSLLMQQGVFLFGETLSQSSIGRVTNINPLQARIQSSLRAILRRLNEQFEALSSLCNENQYALEFLNTFEKSVKEEADDDGDFKLTSTKKDIKVEAESLGNKKRKRVL